MEFSSAEDLKAFSIKESTEQSAANHFWGVHRSTGFPGLVEEVWKERERQLKKWGVQERRAGTSHARWSREATFAKQACADANELGVLSWVHILTEEVYEAFECMDPEEYRTELIQVMAVAASMIFDLDRRGMAPPVVETNGD